MDVVIVGGGAIGLCAALRLADLGRVAIVERDDPGAQASQAAAGILGAQAESHGPGPMLELCLSSRDLYAALAAELRDETGIDVGYRRCGVLELAHDEAGVRELEGRHRWQRARGLACEWQDDVARFPGALRGLRFPGDGQVDNRKLVLALRTLAARRGVTLLRATATGLERGAVLTTEGRIEAGAVVLASGSWSGQLGCPGVRPVRGQMLSYARAPAPLDTVVFGAGGYAVPRADGRLLVGATVEDAGFDASTTEAGLAQLRAVAGRLAPGLAAPDAHWAGLRPGTRDGLPILGRLPSGAIVATGHYRNGILLAPVSAEIVRKLLLGASSDEWRAFSPERASLRPPSA